MPDARLGAPRDDDAVGDHRTVPEADGNRTGDRPLLVRPDRRRRVGHLRRRDEDDAAVSEAEGGHNLLGQQQGAGRDVGDGVDDERADGRLGAAPAEEPLPVPLVLEHDPGRNIVHGRGFSPGAGGRGKRAADQAGRRICEGTGRRVDFRERWREKPRVYGANRSLNG